MSYSVIIVIIGLVVVWELLLQVGLGDYIGYTYFMPKMGEALTLGLFVYSLPEN